MNANPRGLAALWTTLACLAAAGAAWALAPEPPALRASLALLVLAGGLWLTQALPLAVTALLVPLAAVLLQLMTPREALAAFADPVIFLFLGGFALAAALQQQRLDEALARRVMRWAGGRRLRAALMLFGLTALVSMWISNTATAAMMLPLAMGLLRGPSPGAARSMAAPPEARACDATAAGGATVPAAPATGEAVVGLRERAFVLLGLAYSASIGGLGTLVGSPPNAIAAAHAGIGFAQWLAVGLPLVLLLMPLMVGVLALVLRPRLDGGSGRLPAAGSAGLRAAQRAGAGAGVGAGEAAIEEPGPEPWRWSRERVATVVVFVLTAAGWMASAPLARWLGVAADVDSVIALAAIAALVASGALSWPQLERQTSWGVLLLFGGGLALSQLMERHGASRFLGEAVVQALQAAPPVLLVLATVALVVFLSELVSNTACAAVLIPVFGSVGAALGLPAPLMAVAVAAAASCAFMLPVGTPPNALVYATGDVPAALMRRCGLWLNLLCIVVITAVVMAVLG